MMIAWARSMIDAVVIFPMVSLLVVAPSVAFVQHSITAISRPTGIFWVYHSPVHYHPEAIMPPRRKNKLEEGELGTGTAKPVPIWNQNRSGDLFVAMILSLVLLWILSQFLHFFLAKLWSHSQMTL